MESPILPTTIVAQVTRELLTRTEAAAVMAMSLDSFERYVQHGLHLIRQGSMVLVPIGEIRRWVTENQEGLVSRSRTR